MKSLRHIVVLTFILALAAGVGGMQEEAAEEKTRQVVIALSTPNSDSSFHPEDIQERLSRLIGEIDERIGVVHVAVEDEKVDEDLVDRMRVAFDADHVMVGRLNRRDDAVFMDFDLYPQAGESILGASVDLGDDGALRTLLESAVGLMNPSIAVQGVSMDVDKESSWKDGRYTGECTIWPAMKVEVVVKRGRLKSVTVLEDEGTPEFSQKVVDTLPDRMVKQNRIDVDGITAATLSSDNLKTAVRTALEQAN